MSTAFLWSLTNPYEHWVNVILTDSTVVGVGHIGDADSVRVWSCTSAEEAHDTALWYTKLSADNHYVLVGDMMVAHVSVDEKALIEECVADPERIGPILQGLLSHIALHGVVMP